MSNNELDTLDKIIDYIDPQHPKDHWRHVNGKQQLSNLIKEEKIKLLIEIADEQGWEDTVWGYAERFIGINANKFEKERKRQRATNLGFNIGDSNG